MRKLPDMIESSSEHRPLLVVLAFFAMLNAGLFALDAYRPATFLRADRALERLQNIQAVINGATWKEIGAYIGHHGILGDYAAHALLYAAGGRLAVIAFQVALLLVAGIGVYRLARILGLSRRYGSFAAGLYLAMPHSIVFAHQLVTEALHVPLLVISTWVLCEGTLRGRLSLIVASGLLLGVTTLIRPITLLWPLFILLIVAAHRWRVGALFAGMAYLPIALWMAFVHLHTGAYGLGESDHSLDRNLYMRVVAIAATMPAAERARVEREYLTDGDQGRMAPLQYLGFGLQHPWPFARHILRDGAVFLGKSGVERITVDYFTQGDQFEALRDSNDGWRRRLDRDGPVAMLKWAWQTVGVVLIVSLFGAACLVLLIGLAVTGATLLIRGRRRAGSATYRLLAALLIGLPLYTFTFSLVVNAVQSRQRAPTEFALILLATYAIAHFAHSRAQARASTANEPYVNVMAGAKSNTSAPAR